MLMTFWRCLGLVVDFGRSEGGEMEVWSLLGSKATEVLKASIVERVS